MVELLVTRSLHLRRGIATVDLLSGWAIIIVQTTNSIEVFFTRRNRRRFIPMRVSYCASIAWKTLQHLFFDPLSLLSSLAQFASDNQTYKQRTFADLIVERARARWEERNCVLALARDCSVVLWCVTNKQQLCWRASHSISLASRYGNLHLHASQTWGIDYDVSSFPVLVVRSLHKVFDFGIEGKKARKKARKKEAYPPRMRKLLSSSRFVALMNSEAFLLWR